jgi:cytoskeletal protein CcmA (bactofilin family)
MWNNKQSSSPPGPSAGMGVTTLPEPVTAPSPVPAPVMAPAKTALEAPRAHGTATRAPSWLGPGLSIKGQITGSEDLQVDCKVEGPISLGEHRLTVGQNAHVNGEITASEVIVYGNIKGSLLANGRIEIKKHGSVVGDLTTSRIMIEDGAYYKGSIEIARKS